MNPLFLENELKRVGQSKLIEPATIGQKVLEVVNSESKSGSTFIIRSDNND
jgi:hypothetical protein